VEYTIAMAATLLMKAIPLGAAMIYGEIYLLPKCLGDLLATPSALVDGVTLPKAYGLVIIINVVWSGFTMIGLGMKVGKARGTYKEKVSAYRFHASGG
jgi:hypothetical protein